MGERMMAVVWFFLAALSFLGGGGSLFFTIFAVIFAILGIATLFGPDKPVY